MTNPTLRELVDMLPGEMQWHFDRWVFVHDDPNVQEHLILGYLVRWLGERGIGVMPNDGGYTFQMEYGHIRQPKPFPTPLEAAVRAVGVISNQDAT